jgi:hypothetical protein
MISRPRYGVLALVAFAFAGWMVYLVIVPAAEPSVLREADMWLDRQSALARIALGAFISVIGLFLWVADHFRSEMHNDLEMLKQRVDSIATDVTELKQQVTSLLKRTH